MTEHEQCSMEVSPNQYIIPQLFFKKETRTCRMLAMICLVACGTAAQLSVGIIGGSLTLLANAFDQISDMIALTIGFVSIKLGKRKANDSLTFGFKRAEMIGAFINACFPLSTALFVITSAVELFLEPKPIKNANLVMYTALSGVAINLIGMFLFNENEEHAEAKQQLEPIRSNSVTLTGSTETQIKPKKPKKKDVAMRGVFLHVLSDFLGSLIAFLSGAIKKFYPDWKYARYADPVCSLAMAGLLINAAVPLMKTVVKTLMLTSAVSTQHLKDDILRIQRVVGVHELHTWQYVANVEIAHVHVVVKGDKSGTLEHKEYNYISSEVSEVFHRHGIHNTTVQLEIVPSSESQTDCCFGATICGNHAAQCCGHLNHKVLPASHVRALIGQSANCSKAPMEPRTLVIAFEDDISDDKLHGDV